MSDHRSTSPGSAAGPHAQELSDLELLVLALLDGDGLVLEGTADRDPLDDE